MKVPIALTILLILAVGVYLYFEDTLFPDVMPQQEQEEMTEEMDEDDMEICIQVITPARNPETDEIREFPTPCDVPPGWEPIQPEGLELQML